MSETAPEAAEPKLEAETPIQKKRRYNERINALAEGARPAEVSEISARKLFEEWERVGVTIEKCEQMMRDAIAHRQTCVENIIKKLGRTHYRYKGVLYSPSAKTTRDGKVTVFLRALGKHARDV